MPALSGNIDCTLHIGVQGPPGPQGPQGLKGNDGGYYTPAVSYPTEDAVQIDFIPSEPSMPAVQPARINIPDASASAANAGTLYVTATSDNDEPFVADKSSIEIAEAVAQGRSVILSMPIGEGDCFLFPLSVIADDGVLFSGVTRVDEDEAPALVQAVIRGNSVQLLFEDMQTPGGINVTGASVGQIAKISAVDANGVPTAWEPVDFPDPGSNADQNETANIYAGDSEPTDGSLMWIDTAEDQETLVLDNTKWVDGYMQASGAPLITSENGVMFNTDFLPVVPGKTYTFYNTNPDWSADWLAVAFFERDLGDGGIVSRPYANATPYTFTVPSKARYAIISCRNMSANNNYLTAAIVEGSSVPDSGGDTEVTLTSISATYGGGDVAVGTDVSDLTGVVVTARYSDGSTEDVAGYTLSGTIAEGTNTITVSYGGMTTTFTVTGVAESGGEEPDTPPVTDGVWAHGYVGANGELIEGETENSLMYTVDPIPVAPGEVYYLSNTDKGWTGDKAIVAYYTDAECSNFVKRTYAYPGVEVYHTIKITVPDGASYMRVCPSYLYGYEDTYYLDKTPYMPEIPFESVNNWVDGYIAANGTINASNTNGEMTIAGAFSVEPGATYRFGNSADGWTSDWVAYCAWTDSATIKNRPSGNASAGYMDITIPEDIHYIRLSSRNLTNYHTTVTFERIS